MYKHKYLHQLPIIRFAATLLLILLPPQLVFAEIPFRILPNDKLRVEIFADTSMGGIYTVTPDGTLPLPLVREVKVSGMTLAEAADKLNFEYQQYINNAHVNLSIEEYTGHVVTITGAVLQAGMYPFPGNITILEAISLAGGYTNDADISSIQIIRKGQPAKIINLKHIINGNSKGYDINLQANDIVNVPFSMTSQLKDWSQAISPIISVLSLVISLMNAYKLAKEK